MVSSVKRDVLGALATVVVGVGLVSAIAAGIATAEPRQASLQAKADGTVTIGGHTYPRYSLDFAAYPDSMFGLRGSSGGAHPGWVSYSNDNLEAPTNSVIEVTIRQYDTGGTPDNAYFANVEGTIGGTETWNNKAVRSIPVNDVAHTFTLRNIATDAPNLYLNLPLPANSPTAPNVVHIGSGLYPQPQVVTFMFLTKGKGVYQWNCEYPCGNSVAGFGGAMSTYGYMSGTLTVN